MRVQDICSRKVKTCGKQTSLAVAGWLMWELDCGALPVVNDAGKVIGMITDRDICMSAVIKGRCLTEIAVGEVIANQVFTCKLDDDVRVALETMLTHQVRRLPIVDAEGKPQGLLSLNDLALAARSQKEATASDITYHELGATLKAICRHRTPINEKVPEQRKPVVA